MSVLNRIHMGLMGTAFQHATYGWFGEEGAFMSFVFPFTLGIYEVATFTVGVKKSPVEIEA